MARDSRWGIAGVDDGIVELFPTRRAAVLGTGICTRYMRECIRPGLYRYESVEGSEFYVGRVPELLAAGFALNTDLRGDDGSGGYLVNDITTLDTGAMYEYEIEEEADGAG